MHYSFNALLASSLVNLFVACGNNSDGTGPNPNPNPETTNQENSSSQTDPATPNQGSNQEPASDSVPTIKPSGELKNASLDELMAIVAPDFSAQSMQTSELYDRLIEFSSTATETFDNQFIWRPSSLDESPNSAPSLIEGAGCKAIHSGPSNYKTTGHIFEISKAAEKMRYGVEEKVTENFNRKIIEKNPTYSSISFSETTIVNAPSRPS